jgi:hypothetical protein
VGDGHITKDPDGLNGTKHINISLEVAELPSMQVKKQFKKRWWNVDSKWILHRYSIYGQSFSFLISFPVRVEENWESRFEPSIWGCFAALLLPELLTFEADVSLSPVAEEFGCARSG